MIYKIIIGIIVMALSGLVYRGGLQKIPATSANAFYSHNNTENFAAVNKIRFLIDSYIQAKTLKKYLPDTAKPDKEISIRKNNPGQTFLKTSKPNIVLIVLEGIPLAVLDSTYIDYINIPNLRRLQSESYFFENVYASGFRTDQGIASLLSGVPAYPYINTLKDIEELGGHPSILKSVKQKGYHTSFHYGGDSQFSQMKKYLLSQQVDDIIDEEYFSTDERSMDWGVADHILLGSASDYLLDQTEPFFSTILTSSTHLPFDYPGHTNPTNQKQKFIGSVEYLDKALGKFLDKLSTHLSNTLFIITSDHGCLYLGHDFNDHKRFNVPFMVFGDVVKDSLLGTHNYNYFNSHDLPNTLEHVLHLTPSDYPLSGNMTTIDNNTSAYWITEHTMGWITRSQSVVTNHDCNNLYLASNPNLPKDIEIKTLSAYYQSTLHHLLKLRWQGRKIRE